MIIGIFVLRNVVRWYVGGSKRLCGQGPRGEVAPTIVAGDAARPDQASARNRERCAIGALRDALERAAEARSLEGVTAEENVLFSGRRTDGDNQAQRAAPGRFTIAARPASSSANGEEAAVPDVVSSSTTLAQDGSAGLML